MSQFIVTDDAGAELITYSLGSCIGVTVWDPKVQVGGMLHYMLPDSGISPGKAKASPGMFADTGLPLLFRQCYTLGASKRRLIVKIAGAAALFKTSENMDVGRHNYAALRKIFWRNNVLITAESCGGSMSRTLRLNVGSGLVTIENKIIGRVPL